MRMNRPNRRYILVATLLLLSLSLLSCNFFTLPMRVVERSRELTTQVVPEAVQVETVVVEKEVPVEVTRIVEVEKEVVVTATPSAETVAPETSDVLDIESQILTEVYREVNPSVVNVANLARVEVLSEEEVVPQGEGSGFFWDEQGHIVTNAHVVEGADEVQITLYNDVTLQAQVVGLDPDSDLAVVKIDTEGLEIRPVELGNIDDVEVGQRAIAIGNPFRKANTMTQGIISAIGRTIPSLTRYQIPEAIQTDAAINPGNSGGPLLDSEGRVIGVNAQIETGSSLVRANAGIGFAIPVNIVKRVIPALIEEGHYDHAWLGISGQTYSPSWAEELGFPKDARGAYVMYVEPTGPAGEGGLQAGTEDTDILMGLDNFNQPIYLQAGGDLIIAINDQPVEKFDDLLVYLERYGSPGDRVGLTVLRSDGEEETLSVELGTRPESER